MPYTTRQKSAIWKVIEGSPRPLTAREIFDRARREVRGLGLATVYRTLRELGGEGQTRHIEIQGAQPHYEITARSHHHFFLCEHCRKLLDLMGCPRGLSKLLPAGYKMKRHEIVIYGLCASCAKAVG
jgi:Fur family transcriptional regulator, ferric uptake regulator